MTLQSILQKGREEFEKLIQPYQEHCCDGYRHSREDADKCKKMHGYCGYELDHGFDLRDMQSLHDKSKNLLAHHQSEIVETMVGMCNKKMRLKEAELESEKDIVNRDNYFFNLALTDIISELKEVK